MNAGNESVEKWGIGGSAASPELLHKRPQKTKLVRKWRQNSKNGRRMDDRQVMMVCSQSEKVWNGAQLQRSWWEKWQSRDISGHADATSDLSTVLPGCEKSADGGLRRVVQIVCRPDGLYWVFLEDSLGK